MEVFAIATHYNYPILAPGLVDGFPVIHSLTVPSVCVFVCSVMRVRFIETTAMVKGFTAGPQATSLLASSTSTRRMDLEGRSSLMDPAFRYGSGHNVY